MLFLQNRLRKKQEFENVYKQGKACSQGNVFIKFVKNNLNYSRVGFIVSSKFSKKAVERNKIKRQLRAIFQKKISLIKSEVDIVVIPRKEATTKAFKELNEDVEKVLKKAKLII